MSPEQEGGRHVEFRRETVGLVADPGGDGLFPRRLHGDQELLERHGEGPDAVVQEPVRDLLQVYPRLGDLLYDLVGFADGFGEALAEFPVVPEGLEGGGGNGVHRIGTDELLDVEDVPVGRVLGARAGP